MELFWYVLVSRDPWPFWLSCPLGRVYIVVWLVRLQPGKHWCLSRLLTNNCTLCHQHHPVCSCRLHHNTRSVDGHQSFNHRPGDLGCDRSRQWSAVWSGCNYWQLWCGAAMECLHYWYDRWPGLCTWIQSYAECSTGTNSVVSLSVGSDTVL